MQHRRRRGAYEPTPLTDEARQGLERDKREFLTIEDIKLGDSPLAALNRKIRADIEIRYTDGTVGYRGSIYDHVGFLGSVFIVNASEERGGLADQPGIWLGINGMAVGGKRRITIQPELVTSGLLLLGIQRHQQVGIRNEKLIVEATFTASCIPVLLRVLQTGSNYFIEREVRCRDSAQPKRIPSAPIWHLY